MTFRGHVQPKHGKINHGMKTHLFAIIFVCVCKCITEVLCVSIDTVRHAVLLRKNGGAGGGGVVIFHQNKCFS